MTLGLLFWILFVLFVAFRFWAARPAWSDDVLLLAMIFILGWATFGFIIRG